MAATAFGRNGLSDWLWQRFTAIVLMAYTLFIVGYLVANPGVTYEQWSGLFEQFWVRAFSALVLVSIVVHGWIGLWVVLTDYMTKRMAGAIALPARIIVLLTYAVINVVFLVWGVEILWGI